MIDRLKEVSQGLIHLIGAAGGFLWVYAYTIADSVILGGYAIGLILLWLILYSPIWFIGKWRATETPSSSS